MKNLSIFFSQDEESVRICEIIVAGRRADTYLCPAGKFLNSDPLQCDPCPAGQYGDVKGLTECKTCMENFESENEGNTECTPCDYLKLSSPGSSSCQECDETTSLKPSCFLNPRSRDQTTNLVSTSFGPTELRSFKREDFEGYGVGDGDSIPLASLDKPFLIITVVLVTTATEQAVPTINLCTRNTTQSYPNDTLVYTCDKVGIESLTVKNISSVKLYKVFVFGFPFKEAAAPPGHKNNGSHFVKCSPGTFSTGGMITECTPCQANQVQPKGGQSSCNNCNEGYYSAAGASSCTKCGPDTPQCLTTCRSKDETDPKYGHYSWPSTEPGGLAESTCVYNSDGNAYKHCNKETKQFDSTNFGECRSIVHEEVEKILGEANAIHNETEQQKVSDKIQNLTKTSSDVMSSEDVRKTAEIIDKLIEFDDKVANNTLDQNVRENILKTVEKVHKSTDKKEIAKFDTASSLRNSIEKFTKKVSDDSLANNTNVGLLYMKEETMGVVVSNTTGADTSFTISGENSNYTETSLADDDKYPLFSASVPADEEERPVTAVLYNSAAFYPETKTVEDLTSALAQILINSNNSNRVPSKVVSMVTEITYAGSSEKIHFKSGKTIRLKYRVQVENPRAHFKMPLKKKFECVFYDTKSEVWITGDESGCVTKEEEGSNGETFVSCECSHMTSFAVLMSLETDYDPLEATMTTILLGTSLGCLIATIIAYLPSKKFLKRKSVRINLLLVTSLICSIIVFYLMELVVLTNFKEDNVPLESDQASLPCLIVACLMNYFWLCQMAWMVCEAVVLYKALVVVMDPHIHRYMLKFNLFGWGVPVIFPAVGVGWGEHDMFLQCFLREKYGLATFYAPVALCVLFNTSIFLLIIRSRLRKGFANMGRTAGSSDNELEFRKKQFRIVVSVMTWLGITWIFGFFLMCEETNAIWLRWLFIVFNSTQGIFIFVLYVVLNEDIRKVWRELLNIRQSDRTSHSHSGGPRSGTHTIRSRGSGITKSTTLKGNTLSNKSITEMEAEPLYDTLPGQPPMELEMYCPSSPLLTSSLVAGNEIKPRQPFKIKPGPSGVHIYDNFASTLSDSINKRILDSTL
ncbi:hypothetical protein ACHWQZ_G012770 [Mnemiopsis leidyi]